MGLTLKCTLASPASDTGGLGAAVPAPKPVFIIKPVCIICGGGKGRVGEEGG